MSLTECSQRISAALQPDHGKVCRAILLHHLLPCTETASVYASLLGVFCACKQDYHPKMAASAIDVSPIWSGLHATNFKDTGNYGPPTGQNRGVNAKILNLNIGTVRKPPN